MIRSVVVGFDGSAPGLAAHADLLVLGRRAHTGVLGPHLGPVAHAAAHHTECPVALVPRT